MKIFYLSFFIFLVPSVDCMAQAGNDSISAAASPMFKTNVSTSFWMGSNYWKEWTTPIKVPVADLLTIVKRRGGKQTRSLRVADPSGREYNFQSI